jgi:hypothetical protein
LKLRFGQDSERDGPCFNCPARGFRRVREIVAQSRRESRQQYVSRHGVARRDQIRRDALLKRTRDDVDLAPVRAAQIAQQRFDAFRLSANSATMFTDDARERVAW